jgi:superfamily II DNA or RNA helicase
VQLAIPAQGTMVWIRHHRWLVEHVRCHGAVVQLDVRDRHGPMTFLSPFDRWSFDGERRRPVEVRVQSAAARLAQIRATTRRLTSVNAASRARIDLHPYQLEPALAMLHGRRRVLIADEVGLGKTIQAGLLLAELEKRQTTLRALIVCPVTLRPQWAAELSDRFGLSCRVADRDGLVSIGRTKSFGDSPWDTSGIWISSIDFLKQPHVAEALPVVPWDVLVIDEAHDMCGTTERHDTCQALACRARHVLTLTATPHSGNAQRFDRLLKLGQMGGDEVAVFRRTRVDLAIPVHRRVRWHGVRPSDCEARLLDTLESYERAVLREAGQSHHGAAILLLSVLRKRALSTRAAFARSLRRRHEWRAPAASTAPPWTQPDLALDEDDHMRPDEDEALMADLGMKSGDERVWLERLTTAAAYGPRHESKICRLCAFARRTGEPMVVFTEFRDSLEAVRQTLEREGPVAYLHGGQPPSERLHQLERFERHECRILIATDVAGQGLNLQGTARWIIMLELPWNPAKLEQRIGRVDRIGQRRTVHATLLTSRHRAESTLLAVLSRRTLEARRVLGPSTFAMMAVPSEWEVGRLLLDDVLPEAANEIVTPSASISLNTEFRRRARALARVIRCRRDLQRRWRCDVQGTRPFRCRTHGVSQVSQQRPGTPGVSQILVFRVPLLDGTGQMLEQHVLVLRGQLRTPTANGGEPGSSVESLAMARFEARRRRLSRLRRRADAALTAGRRAVDSHLLSLCRPGEVQSALFTRAEIDTFECGRRAADDLVRRLEAAVEHERRALDVSIGGPVLEAVFVPK